MKVEISTIALVTLVQTPIIVIITLLLNRLVNYWEARSHQNLMATVIRKWG